MEDINKLLKSSFVSAANQLTQLYVHSLQQQQHSFAIGYNTAVESIIQFVISNITNSASSPSPSSSMINVELLLDFLKKERTKYQQSSSSSPLEQTRTETCESLVSATPSPIQSLPQTSPLHTSPLQTSPPQTCPLHTHPLPPPPLQTQTPPLQSSPPLVTPAADNIQTLGFAFHEPSLTPPSPTPPPSTNTPDGVFTFVAKPKQLPTPSPPPPRTHLIHNTLHAHMLQQSQRELASKKRQIDLIFNPSGMGEVVFTMDQLLKKIKLNTENSNSGGGSGGGDTA